MQSDETGGANRELFKENVDDAMCKIHMKSDSVTESAFP